MAKVSLMVPVYNTEPYIEKSLRSVLEQTFEDLEIVIVNDATPDGAMAVVERVLREYPNRQSQVKIINHTVNGGLAVARQTAIDNATGEYTIHLDSDDWVEPNMVERLYERAKRDNADIVVCDFYFEYPERQVYSRQSSPSTGKELVGALLRGDLNCSGCNKLVRRSLYTDNDLNWIPGINNNEDLIITVKLSYFADRISYLPEAFMHYWKGNPQSYSASIRPKTIDDLSLAVKEIERFLNAKPDASLFVDDLIHRKLFVRINLICKTNGVEQRKIAAWYPEIPRKYILKNSNLWLHNRIAAYFASFGWFWAANLIYRMVHLIKK